MVKTILPITSLLFQVKMELTGNSGSSCPQQNLSTNPGQQHNSKDSSNSDDPLAAIMNQTIFEGKVCNNKKNKLAS